MSEILVKVSDDAQESEAECTISNRDGGAILGNLPRGCLA